MEREYRSHIQEFTPEARKSLEDKGYIIYPLMGQSIETLRDGGKRFWSTWHKDFPELEEMKSRLYQVAINPEQLFLPDSNRKTLKEQEQMVKKFSRSLEVDGVEAIVGEIPDYAELAFSHFDATGGRLFGQVYDYNYTKTVTSTGGSDVAHVGRFDADSGLAVFSWNRGEGRDDLFVAPLVVPKA